MSSTSKTRRRIFGSVCLGLALLMVVVGQTALKGRLDPLPFLLYWVACLILTILAMFTALVDALRIHTEGRESQRELIEDTIRKVQEEKSRRNHGNAKD